MKNWPLWSWLSVIVVGVPSCVTVESGFKVTPVTDSVVVPSTVVHRRPLPTGSLSLDSAIRVVLDSHPELDIARLDKDAHDAVALQARTGANPAFSVEIEDVGGSGSFAGTDGMATTIAVRQPVLLAGKRLKRWTVADLDSQLAEWDARERRHELIGKTTMAFYQTWAAQEHLSLRQQNLELLERFVAGVDKRVESGAVSPVQSTKVRVELAEARVALRRANRELQRSRATLAGLWSGDVTVLGAVELDAVVPQRLPPVTSLRSTLKHHPRLARWGTEKARREAVLQLARAEAWPDLELGMGVRQFNETDDHAFLLEVSLPLPVLDRNHGRIAEAEARLAQSDALYQRAWRDLQSQISAFHAEIQAIEGEIATLRDELLPQAEHTYAAVDRAFNAGDRGVLEVLDAERTLLAARQSYLERQIDYRLKLAELASVLGVGIDTVCTDSSTNRGQE